MRKRFIAILALAVVVLAGCGSHHYEFRPEQSESGGDPRAIECGIVEYVHSNGWVEHSEAVGRVCVVDR